MTKSVLSKIAITNYAKIKTKYIKLKTTTIISISTTTNITENYK